MKSFELHIGLSRTRSTPVPGNSSYKTMEGGPDTLLGWLENQLALPGPEHSRLDRVLSYLDSLENHPDASFTSSKQKDAWATARYLLARRDELMMAGWDGEKDPDLPGSVNDLAAVESTGPPLSGHPDRLEAIRKALESGQNLPDHNLYLHERPRLWPPKWQAILDHLDLSSSDIPETPSDPENTLERIQSALRGNESIGNLKPDDHFGILDARSRHRACRAIASMLTAPENPEPAHTVIACENDSMRERLDQTFRASGLPALGSARTGQHQAALQVLPLLLEMLWKPVEPRTLVDFLSLSVKPVPDHIAHPLIDALSSMPGLGSRAWEKTWNRIIEKARDPERVKNMREKWFHLNRTERGNAIPLPSVRDVCSHVQQWAKGYAESLDEQSPPQLYESLTTAAGMASGFRDLLGRRNQPMTKPQLDRMMEDLLKTVRAGIVTDPSGKGPILLEGLEDIPRGTNHLIWIDVTSEERVSRPWTNQQEQKLEEGDIPVRTMTDHRHEARRNQEQRGLLQVSDSLTVVRLLQNVEKPGHPLYLQIKNVLDEEVLEKTDLSIDARLQSACSFSAPFSLLSRERDIEPPQPERPEWNIPRDLIIEPDHTSSSEMQERLGCPAKWVFHRSAFLDTSSASKIPEAFRLKGLFSHQLFEDLFEEASGTLQPEEAKQKMQSLFDDRVHTDAVPLALPRNMSDRKKFRKKLGRAARQFAQFLASGEYRVKKMEHHLEGRLNGKPVRGRIDCLLESRQKPGREAVLDMKFGGRSKYPSLLEEGRALQLAVYCRAREREIEPDGSITGTGYFLIGDARLVTPEGFSLRGAEEFHIVEGAESPMETWERFASALRNDVEWRGENGRIPARPLMNEDEWPPGANLAIDTDGRKDREELKPCTYCDYKRLCGIETCE